MALRCAQENIAQQVANSHKLAVGEQPHGFPALKKEAILPPEFAESYKALGKKINSVAAELNTINAALEEFERNLITTRRVYETVVDGFTRRSDRFEELSKQ